jgi:1,4-alpha-glucan branching enzyme
MKSFSGMGAVFERATGECGFRVWAPNANRVKVHADFLGWGAKQVPLTSEGNGNWSGIIKNVPANGQYQFVLDDVDYRVDPYARDVDSDKNDNMNGLVVDTEAPWQWHPFATPRMNDIVVYQLHVGSFAGRNDGIATQFYDNNGWVATCNQIIPKLPYIKRMGFNAIALLPLGEYPRPANQAHMGYAPTNWFAPESDYGWPNYVRNLVNEAHLNGLAVIFDVVYNHASTDQNYYWNFDACKEDGGIYFEHGGESNFGHKPAHWKWEVKQMFLDNARMWLDYYRCDGLRFDAADLIQWESLQHIIYNLRCNPYWRDKIFIAEWSGDKRNEWQAAIDDIGFNAVWEMASPWAFREAIKRGAFGGDAIDAILPILQQDCVHPSKVVQYMDGCHDTCRDEQSGGEKDHRYPVEYFGGRDNACARAQARMGWALTACARGIPMLFMGTEGHIPGYWWPTLDQNPVDSEHRLDWWRVGDPTGGPMQHLVAGANWMRHNHGALRGDSLEVTHADRNNGVLAFRRWNYDGDVVLTVVNFSNHEWLDCGYAVRTGVGGTWEEIFNSQAPSYGGYENSGSGPGARGCDGGGYLHIRLPSWSVVCFRQVG